MKRISNIFRTSYAQQFRVLRAYVIVALVAPYLAGHDPLVVYTNNNLLFPAFTSSPYVQLHPDEPPVLKSSIDWRTETVDFKLMPLVCYSPHDQDAYNTNYASPFGIQYSPFVSPDGLKNRLDWRYRHWLGTTRTGQDVLAILLYGCRTSLVIGFGAVLISALIALMVGIPAGYFGNTRLKIRRRNCWTFIVMAPVTFFYAHQLASLLVTANIARYVIIVLLLAVLARMVSIPLKTINDSLKAPNSNSWLALPVDRLFTLLTTLFIAMPRLVVVVVLASLFTPSLTGLMLIIGLTSWAEPARLIRTEVLRITQSSYIEHARSSGTTLGRIIARHLLPNLSVMVTVLFLTGIATAIITEAGLSFLGIGLPFDTPSWGMLIAEGRRNIQAWWLVVVPGVTMIVLLRALMSAGRSAKAD